MSVDALLILGVNHTTAPVEVRERLACGNDLDGLLEDLSRSGSCKACLLLSTCNRVETLLLVSDPQEAVRETVHILFHDKLSQEEQNRCLYRHQGEKAVEHLFRVGCGLDSMVMGEPQILGQLKDAFRKAVERDTLGPVLHRLVSRAFSVSKRVRTETGIGSHAVSISYAAVELAKKIFGDLDGKKTLLIGAGEMAELAAQHLQANGVQEIVVANRTLSRAVDLARSFDGTAISLGELQQQLQLVDICISSTGATGYILNRDMVRDIMRRRHGRPLFLIDIAVPRDIDPGIDEIDNVFLYDIDDLRQVVEKNKQSRLEEAVKAKRIIQEETLKFCGWLEGLAMAPVITGLREKAARICSREMERTVSRMEQLSEKDRRALEKMTAAITAKLLYHPISYAKNGADDPQQRLALLRQVFGLNDTNDATP